MAKIQMLDVKSQVESAVGLYSMPRLQMQPNHLATSQARLVAETPLQWKSDGISVTGDDKDSL